MDQLKIEILPGADGTRILRLDGPLTLTTLFEFQDAARHDRSAVTIVDLTAVPYMDSAALGAILGIHVSCQKDERKYALVGAGERLEVLFRVAGVDGILVRFPTLEQAQAQLTSHGFGASRSA